MTCKKDSTLGIAIINSTTLASKVHSNELVTRYYTLIKIKFAIVSHSHPFSSFNVSPQRRGGLHLDQLYR